MVGKGVELRRPRARLRPPLSRPRARNRTRSTHSSEFTRLIWPTGGAGMGTVPPRRACVAVGWAADPGGFRAVARGRRLFGW